MWNDLFADNNSESSSESGKAESETQDQTPTPESADLQPLPELGESSPGDSKAESNTEPDSSNGSENAVANPAPQPDKRAIDASDPYAQSIPPSTPNKKEVIPAATTDIQADKPVTDATYYQPVIGEQPPLPLEIIPLDDSAPVTHSVNYSPADDKPYDSLGINIPYGEIKVTRFPRIDNTTEPKYTASLF